MMIDALDVQATVRYVPMSPQKVRLVLDIVRGMPVNEALDTLRFVQKSAAKPVYKLIHSAAANAEENYGMNRDALVIHSIYADQGPTRNWRRFGARGRFKPLRRRQSHITVILREQEAMAT
jgi:large subunit ribosomal protein L22